MAIILLQIAVTLGLVTGFLVLADRVSRRQAGRTAEWIEVSGGMAAIGAVVCLFAATICFVWGY